ncbi:MAG: hypothetical protein OIF40_09905 [Mangrovicoccus sp.]|nr:hypothetical protein [Mangrovicoccus sp.]
MDVCLVPKFEGTPEPCSLYIGSFFPWISHHTELLQDFEKKSNFKPVVCLLYPSPFVLLRQANGDCDLPYVEGLEQLIDRIRHHSGQNVVLCRMTAADLEASPGVFFELLNSVCSVRELWLRQNQTIGRGKEGSLAGLKKRFEGSSCKVCVLPKMKERYHRTEVFEALRRGSISRFHEATGYYPTLDWQVSRSLEWADGNYVGRYHKDGALTKFSVKSGVPDFDEPLTSGHGLLSVIKGPGEF